MNRKELVEELIKLEADFDELCKKQKDVIEKMDANINDDKVFIKCLNDFKDINKEIDENREKFWKLVN
ncbi:MAG: hypothetical protein J6T48_10105 [Bacteroidales bacterium]|nr:hypothetical protein [Bacteroidales bacterium]